MLKEILLKSFNESLKFHIFFTQIILRKRKTDFVLRLISIFFPYGRFLEHLTQFFNVIIQILFYIICNANLHRFLVKASFFSGTKERGLGNSNTKTCKQIFILFNKLCLIPEVFHLRQPRVSDPHRSCKSEIVGQGR